jgi:hypothetical protein
MLKGLTFDMSNGCKRPKHACSRPLDEEGHASPSPSVALVGTAVLLVGKRGT